MRGNIGSGNLGDIASRLLVEIGLVGAAAKAIPLAAKDAAATGLLKAQAHAANARKKIDKAQRRVEVAHSKILKLRPKPSRLWHVVSRISS